MMQGCVEMGEDVNGILRRLAVAVVHGAGRHGDDGHGGVGPALHDGFEQIGKRRVDDCDEPGYPGVPPFRRRRTIAAD
ncbi:hypothetical protein HYQ46_006037 [Verticillium longisporum]|nr:hypothetical protein HYQ46_006037 [Verticillium longisporum]